MDPIIRFSHDKRIFTAQPLENMSFFDIINQAKKLNVTVSAALSACAEFHGSKGCDPRLVDFLHFSSRNAGRSKSQLLQDVFALYVKGRSGAGKFFEFGATDGVSLSNSQMLERHFGWTGVLAEPSPQWHESLLKNRSDATIILDCVWNETGKVVDFFVSDIGVLSSMKIFSQSDKESMPGNSIARNKAGYVTQVKTIAINDIMRQHFPDGDLDYMSVDTEGSELDILQSLDFKLFSPRVLTVEHNFTYASKEIDSLLLEKEYIKIFTKQTAFDAWYVKSDALPPLT